MRSVALVGILLSTTILGGCAGTIGGITLSSISSFAGLASTLFTGADLGEHAASLLTGKDCRFSEGLMRADRDVCEERGSLATRDDFHGIFVDRIEEDGTVVYAAPKYMPASFGAGEFDNKPDEIWAAIKTQKLAEANERALARAETATQTIDVAALATGSVSSESLAFLPAGTRSDADLIDGDTASLTTASSPRTLTNTITISAPEAAAKRVATAPEVDAPEAISVPIDMSQPAIDEKSFAAAVQPKQNGEGGPFIATAASSTPVASTLINGEPVVVLRLRPIFSANSTPSTAVTSAMPVAMTETASAEPATFVTPLSQKTDMAPSPQAILDQAPARAELPTETVASIEPPREAARPRLKPAAAPIVEEAKPKPVRATPAPDVERQRRIERDAADVYQPPARSDLSADAAPLRAPVQTPVDVPAEPTPAVAPMSSTSFSSPAPMAPISEAAPEPTPSSATGGPAPLVPMPQE